MRHGYKLILSLLLLFLAAPPTLAQDGVITTYTEGLLSFDYQQWPWGSYSGTFFAEGPEIPDGFPPEVYMGAGGRMEVVADTTVAWAFGAILQDDAKVDMAAVMVRAVGDIEPGSYDIDFDTFMVEFGYFDNISDFYVPDGADSIVDWLSNMVADHKFIGTAGTINVSEVSDTTFIGTFDGTMVDESFLIIEISNGVFNMIGEPGTGVESTPGFVSAHANFPNPFNPKTRIHFATEEGAWTRVSVHDVSGREVSVIDEGWLAPGEHNYDWQARDEAGHKLPAGLYLYRIESGGACASGKMVLLP